MANFNKLTNSYQKIKMFNLHLADDGKGPFILAQDGYAPDDETLTTRPFLLRNDGTWVLSYHFACLPKKEQWRFAFESMVEVVKILEEIGRQDVRAIWTLPDGISPEEALRRYKTALPKSAAAIRDGTPVAAPSLG